tara:strand:- start:39 stop:281 length:243 start_codon:yes stop_codon:yes gene_type:complete
MAKLIKANGDIVPNVDISSLKKMQDLVQGYIQLSHLDNGKVLIVNEEGLLNNLPPNKKASELRGYLLVGDVIECGISELK